MAKRPKQSTHISLDQAINIPLDQLVLSDANVRNIGAADKDAVRELANSIARRSLLQSLMVRPLLDTAGKETGTYEVPGGGRRLRALQLLVKQKRLAADTPIPCIVKTTGLAEEDSLAENNDRKELHPLDQYRAFAALRAKGQSEEDIAAAFAVTPAVVRQRLRLADASPALLDAYAREDIDLDVLMAFCITPDTKRQEQVYASMQDSPQRMTAWSVRRRLTEETVPSDDRRVRFIGLDTYTQAGGPAISDLFSKEGQTYLQDAALVDKLVADKLAALRERVLSAGWSWCIAALDVPWSQLQGYDTLKPAAEGITPKMVKRLERLTEIHDEVSERIDNDDDTPEDHAKLQTLEQEIADIQSTPPVFTPKAMKRSGVIIRVDHDGHASYRWGAIARDAKASNDADDPASATTIASGEEAVPSGSSRLSETLARDLTAFRTAGLRDALANNFEIAFIALLHALAARAFHDFAADQSCLTINATTRFHPDAAGIADFPALKASDERHRMWKDRLPKAKTDLWTALLVMSTHDRQLLFAHCVGLTLDAVTARPDQPTTAYLHSHKVAEALGFTIQQAGWVTRADDYLDRVTKTRILEAVTEAKGERTAELRRFGRADLQQ